MLLSELITAYFKYWSSISLLILSDNTVLMPKSLILLYLIGRYDRTNVMIPVTGKKMY